MTTNPLLSIITICLNDKSGLEKTILSVKEQTFRDYEHLIIDGGSVDGSKEIIEKYKSYLAFTISERDNGRYQAMNKGIQNSKGIYLLFLNSGDYLADNFVLQKILSDADMPDIKYGNVIFEDINGLRSLYEQPAVFYLKYF
ncbi:MAG: glycosyltransferase, partial [Bacteroidia bacterium]|nr:glycosyltransferase [Bacteroidia bacterium]